MSTKGLPHRGRHLRVSAGGGREPSIQSSPHPLRGSPLPRGVKNTVRPPHNIKPAPSGNAESAGFPIYNI